MTQAELEKAKNRFLTGQAAGARNEQWQGERARRSRGDLRRSESGQYRPGQTQAVTDERDQRSFEPLPLREEESRDRVSAGSDEACGADEGGEEILMSRRMTFRKESCSSQAAKPARDVDSRNLHFLRRESQSIAIPLVLRRIGMTSVVAIAFCLTTVQSASAIGGVDTAAGAFRAARDEIRHPERNAAGKWIARDRGGAPGPAALSPRRLVVRSGAEVDPPDLAGTASMTGELLTKGTETMSAPRNRAHD